MTLSLTKRLLALTFLAALCVMIEVLDPGSSRVTRR